MRKILFAALFSALFSALIVSPASAQIDAKEEVTEESLSRADALSRTGDKKEALAILERFLEERPGHTGAELLYARTLSWSGQYERAIEVYREILRREPENSEAHAGLARVLSWKGDYAASVEAYRRSLFLAPRATEVRMGLARTLWWKGDVEGSLEELDKVITREPENIEALGLERRLRLEKGPYLRANYANSVDSDDNRLELFHLAFHDTFGLKGHSFDFGYKSFDASLPYASARASVLDARDSIRFRDIILLTPRLALVSLDSDKDDTVYLTGGIGFSMPVAIGTNLSAAYNRYPLLDTAVLIENNIRVKESSLAVTHDIGRATLSASAAFADYSDGNTRYDLGGGVAVNVMDEPLVIAGLTSEYRAFSEKAVSGYFNPPHIFSNSLYLDASGRIWQRLGYRAKATLGIQSFEEKRDLTSSFQGLLEWAASRDLWLEAGYKYSRSALESASGFRFEEFRAGLNYLF